jgi:uncharacterized protein (DUF1330 family)
MTAYAVFTYDVKDPDTYAKYNPGSMGVILETLGKHGGEILAATGDSHWVEGSRHVTVIIKFPSVDAAKAWIDDPDYAEAKAIRLSSTENIINFVAPEFAPPGG